MRKSGRLKLGHYPLPLEEAQRLKSMLHFSESASVLDPCIGTGTALMSLTENVDCHRYGIELDADRAQAASAAGIETVQGSVFDTHCKVEMFSLLYLNPPYDSEIGSFDNDRMEFLFLEHTYRWLKIGGVLVFVIPLHRLTHAAGILSSHFSDLRVLRLSHPESVRFHQIVVMGVRKPQQGSRIDHTKAALQRMAHGWEPLPELDANAGAVYAVPASPPATLTYRGLPLDQVEDLLPQSNAYKQLGHLLLPKEELAAGRPITPLHGGHVGLLCTAGLLNGVFGTGEQRHIARWRSVKYTTTIREDDEDVQIVRKRERLSNELAIVYADGRTLLLTESPRSTNHEERTSENGNDRVQTSV